jgi:hypothetical protein
VSDTKERPLPRDIQELCFLLYEARCNDQRKRADAAEEKLAAARKVVFDMDDCLTPEALASCLTDLRVALGICPDCWAVHGVGEDCAKE